MKIYFTVSISKMTPEIRIQCEKIINYLKSKGHIVCPEDILTKSPDHFKNQSEEQKIAKQEELTNLKKQSDVVFAEVTNQSLGIGQEIALSLSMNLPVVALYTNSDEPHILKDDAEDKLVLLKYNDESMQQVIDEAIHYASEHQDVRFNFFISPRIGNYLDWVARHKKIPRSVYLRQLIEEDMKRNQQ